MDLLASKVAGKKVKDHSAKNLKRLLKHDSKKTKTKIMSIFNSEESNAKTSKKEKADNSLKNMSSKKKKLVKNFLGKQITENIKSENKIIQVSKENKPAKEIKKLKKLKEAEPKNVSKLQLKKNKTSNEAKSVKNIIPKDETKSKDVANSKNKLNNMGLSNKQLIKNRKVLKEVKGQNVETEVLESKKTIKIKGKSSKAKNVQSSKPLQATTIKETTTKVKEEIINVKAKKRKQDDEIAETESGIFKKKEIVKYVNALLKVVENEEKKNVLFDSEKPPIFLNITCFKVAHVPLHQLRIILPHSIVSPTDDVALFVKDLKKGRRINYEDTKQHYEDLLEKQGCTQIKSVIPFNQVKTEYRQFETRKRLLNSYDHFLIDGRIAGHMSHLLGKPFRESRKLPISIHMEKDLKTEIDVALKKTSLQIHGNGDSSVVQIGTFSMSVSQIADNIIAVIEDLKKNFPGGWENIRALRIKTPLSMAIPIYMTLKSKNEVEVPKLSPKRPKAYQDVEGELSTVKSNIKVIVSPDGTVVTQKMDDDSNEESDQEKD